MIPALKLRPSCPGMGRRIELCVHMAELADLLALCRKGRYSLAFCQSAKASMTNLCRELVQATERFPKA